MRKSLLAYTTKRLPELEESFVITYSSPKMFKGEIDMTYYAIYATDKRIVAAYSDTKMPNLAVVPEQVESPVQEIVEPVKAPTKRTPRAKAKAV